MEKGEYVYMCRGSVVSVYGESEGKVGGKVCVCGDIYVGVRDRSRYMRGWGYQWCV